MHSVSNLRVKDSYWRFYKQNFGGLPQCPYELVASLIMKGCDNLTLAKPECLHKVEAKCLASVTLKDTELLVAM